MYICFLLLGRICGQLCVTVWKWNVTHLLLLFWSDHYHGKCFLWHLCVFSFHVLCSPKGEAYSRRFVRPSVWYLVRQITDNRWQWREGRTIILPCLFTEVSLHNHLFFHNECLSGPYLVKYKWDWNETYIQRYEWKEVQKSEP